MKIWHGFVSLTLNKAWLKGIWPFFFVEFDKKYGFVLVLKYIRTSFFYDLISTHFRSFLNSIHN